MPNFKRDVLSGKHQSRHKEYFRVGIKEVVEGQKIIKEFWLD